MVLAALAAWSGKAAAAGQVRGELLVSVQVVGSCTANLAGEAVAQRCAAETPSMVREEQPELDLVPAQPSPAATARALSTRLDGLTYITVIY
jgi:hypothetical protein